MVSSLDYLAKLELRINQLPLLLFFLGLQSFANLQEEIESKRLPNFSLPYSLQRLSYVGELNFPEEKLPE